MSAVQQSIVDELIEVSQQIDAATGKYKVPTGYGQLIIDGYAKMRAAQIEGDRVATAIKETGRLLYEGQREAAPINTGRS